MQKKTQELIQNIFIIIILFILIVWNLSLSFTTRILNEKIDSIGNTDELNERLDSVYDTLIFFWMDKYNLTEHNWIDYLNCTEYRYISIEDRKINTITEEYISVSVKDGEMFRNVLFRKNKSLECMDDCRKIFCKEGGKGYTVKINNIKIIPKEI